MALPLVSPTPKPPAPPRKETPHHESGEPEFYNIERLDRPELDDAPDTDRSPPTLPSLEWEEDGESGVKRRG